MSGEAGGVILGGAILLGAIPLVVAGVCVAAAAAGTFAVGKTAVQAAARRAERRKQEHGLEISQCSARLSNSYERLCSAMARQAQETARCYEGIERRMQALSEQMEQVDLDSAESALWQMRNACSHEMGQVCRTELERIHKETRVETDSIMEDLRQTQREQMELLDWSARSEATKAGQLAFARELARDAEATLRLLRALADSGGQDFRQQVDILDRLCQRSQQAIKAGAFQAAVAEAQDVVSKGAVLALEHSMRQAERDEISSILEARLEGLLAEMDGQESISFEDPFYGHIVEYLDDFTQGAFQQTRQEARDLLETVRQDSGERSPSILSQRLEYVENELLPHAVQVAKTGRERMLGYYERLHALQIIGDYMKEQGYAMDWAQPAGDDVTQKLVLHFQDLSSGNTVAVSLDEDADAEDSGKMAMEVMFYYANRRPVTESEKQAYREGMLRALRKRGVGGSLQCTGSVQREADDKTMNSAEAIRNLVPRPLTFR